ncbi:MAG TPA: glycosyltransferase family 39 protein, partial [Blastocatellia bacterium]|nr:glycosyltransferase family 39 protein [Blastocatellia bacterium]
MCADALSPQAGPSSHATGADRRLRRRAVVGVFAAIALVTFLLRIFYSGHLYQDDGLWFTAAEELLRGKALYRDVYFDKPPGIVLVYAGLFKLFGAHLLTIRLFTIIYSVAMSAALYAFGRRLYDERTGLTAAAMFAVFSTIYTTGHVQGLNTDLLMALPYTAAAYWLLRSRDDVFGRRVTRRQSAGWALAGGAALGAAMQINPKGAFGFLFFALFLLLARFWKRGDTILCLRAWLFSLVGFVAGTLPFVLYLAATHAVGFYWLYVWDWGARYARYYPASHVMAT